MNRRNQIILGLLALVAGWYYIPALFSGPPTPASLATTALSAASHDDRVFAASALSMMTGFEVVTQMKRLASDSKDADIQAVAVSFLASSSSFETLPVLYAAMDSPDAGVRRAGLKGVQRLFGGDLPANIKYAVDASPEERKEAARRLEEIYNRDKLDPKDLSPKQPKAGPAPDAKGTTTLAEAKKDKEAPSPDSSAPPPPSGSAASPFVSAAPAAPFVPRDYPAVTLLVWMCRVLAVLFLLAELAGGMSLILGERNQAARLAQERKMLSHSKHTKLEGKVPPSVSDEFERALNRNSMGLWCKIAILAAGALAVVALLTVAEVVQLAARMDQNMEYISSRVR